MTIKLDKALEMRFDANEKIFFERQLEHIEPKIYMIKKEQLYAREVFPVSFEGGPGIDRIYYYMMDKVGTANWIANGGTNAPRADIYMTEHVRNVGEFAASWGWTKQEFRRAQRANMSLSDARAMAAKRAMAEFENRAAFDGDAARGIQGFFDNPSIPRIALPNGAGGKSTFADKTADEMLEDLHLIANSPFNLTNGIERADTMLVSPSVYTRIAETRFKDAGAGARTVLEQFLATNPFIKSVMPIPKCKEQAPDGSDIIVAYRKDPEVLEMSIPMDLLICEVREEGDFGYKVALEQSSAGVVVRYPLAIAFGLGA